MTAPDWLCTRPIAHRGLHNRVDVIENTADAAEAAIARGFPIECDVQLTADGEAVVYHDFVLDRLTHGQGRLDAHTAAALAAIPFKATGNRIEPLSAFLDRIGGRVPLVIEVKSRFDGNLALIRRTAAVVDSRSEPLAVMSFDPDVIAAFKDLAPGVPRGIVAESRYEDTDWVHLNAEKRRELAQFLHINHSRPDFLAWRVADLPATATVMARHFGMPVLTWTVRSLMDREQAAAHADQMIFEDFVP
ncbi:MULTISPECIES: glycerophosphodiester phosphodiesterase family protein [unclassified Chelatococcus]|uniref:glycerophosphodiester phosphodiesterase family protein n=1 Tax=unclassified Chelatococcus TaxID=2638111 RepID=UPI001BCF740B|nr:MULTISPECIES: glycerophosphodiester phosphodiesterase family protein [unclassified Chelatococcus]MBS7698241.1 glycerophosphodiester phosphodiesterase [Chelatococcus sp. YT9]MBX3559848.1 glycerophosphodiester phosphodiesterase [Chelatococcus sp.]